MAAAKKRSTKAASTVQEESSVAAAPQPRNGHLFAEKDPKTIILNGLVVEGAFRDLLLAYNTQRTPQNGDPAGVAKWRRLYRDKPERFMSIMEALEKKQLERQKEAKEHAAEFERLQASEAKLKADLTAALKELAELRKLLPSELDEYDDPGLERVNELMDKLLDGYGAKPGLSP